MDQEKRRRRWIRGRTEPLLLAVFVGTALLLFNQLRHSSLSPTQAAYGGHDDPSFVVAVTARTTNRTAAAADFTSQTHRDSSSIRPRAFTAWNHSHSPLPCEPLDNHWQAAHVQTSPASAGLLLVKTYKTGSSTAAGVTLRMAQQIARKRNLAFEVAADWSTPKARWTLWRKRFRHTHPHKTG
jgi:hypothetical protein